MTTQVQARQEVRQQQAVRPEGGMNNRDYAKLFVGAVAALGVGLLAYGAYKWANANNQFELDKAGPITHAGYSILSGLAVAGGIYWCCTRTKVGKAAADTIGVGEGI